MLPSLIYSTKSLLQERVNSLKNICFILTWFVLETGGERLRKQDSELVRFQQVHNYYSSVF